MSLYNRKEKILVVDDDPDTLEMLQRNLESKGYNTVPVYNRQAAEPLLVRGQKH